MNPEKFATERIDNERRSEQIERTAERLLNIHPRVEKTLDEQAIDMGSFSDLYGTENIQKDTAEVTRLQQLFYADGHKSVTDRLTMENVRQLSQILEFYMLKGINNGKWIPYCNAIKTSEFDDIKNGVDLVLEYMNKDNHAHFGLAVDVTFANDISKKMQRIKQSIDEDELSKVKYFTSKRSAMRGELTQIPRVITAIDLQILEDLHTSDKNKHLEGHQIRAALVEDMDTQLATFATYAEQHHKQCAAQLKRAQRFMHLIGEYTSKEKDPEYLQKHEKTRQKVADALQIFS